MSHYIFSITVPVTVTVKIPVNNQNLCDHCHQGAKVGGLNFCCFMCETLYNKNKPKPSYNNYNPIFASSVPSMYANQIQNHFHSGYTTSQGCRRCGRVCQSHIYGPYCSFNCMIY